MLLNVTLKTQLPVIRTMVHSVTLPDQKHFACSITQVHNYVTLKMEFLALIIYLDGMLHMTMFQ